MSRTNYEAVSDCVGHWLHRAQVSLLTGTTGQIKLSHIVATSEKTLVRAWCGPGAGVRAWCGPGAGLARAWCGPRSLTNAYWTKASAKTYVNMFEGPVTGNIPEVLDNGEVTDSTHVTAGQLALALTPYAQVTDLAVNTAAPATTRPSSPWTTESPPSWPQSWTALAPAIAALATAAALATTDGQVAAHGSSIAALQLTTGLSNKADQSAFDVLEGVTKSTPDSVDLKLSNYSTTAAMNGSIASANNATLATAAANYGLKTVVDQHSLRRGSRRWR